MVTAGDGSRAWFDRVTIECVRGNIVEQPDVDAIVNAANAELAIGGGIAGAVHRAAGPELDQACRPLAPIRPGEAVITPGFRLPNRFVIHCLGPIYGHDLPAPELLASCYRAALRLADDNDLESIAFPAISTGAFGYPIAEAAPIALGAVVGEAPTLRHVRRIRFVLFSEADREAHARALAEIAGGGSSGQPR
jgi:O-acetyl-ADP-ribose deacetylase